MIRQPPRSPLFPSTTLFRSLRVHQFDKVELVRFARPADSATEHELLTRHAETVLQRLELPYRVVLLAAGDVGFTRSEEHTSELQSQSNLVCRLLLDKKNTRS